MYDEEIEETIEQESPETTGSDTTREGEAIGIDEDAEV